MLLFSREKNWISFFFNSLFFGIDPANAFTAVLWFWTTSRDWLYRIAWRNWFEPYHEGLLLDWVVSQLAFVCFSGASYCADLSNQSDLSAAVWPLCVIASTTGGNPVGDELSASVTRTRTERSLRSVPARLTPRPHRAQYSVCVTQCNKWKQLCRWGVTIFLWLSPLSELAIVARSNVET